MGKRKSAAYQTLFNKLPLLVDARLSNLVSLWEKIFEHFEPDYPSLVHPLFQGELEDADMYALWTAVRSWPDNEVQALRMWFKHMLGDKLTDDSYPQTTQISFFLYAVAEAVPIATSGMADYRLLDPNEFPGDLTIGSALGSYNVVKAALEGKDPPEGVVREEYRLKEIKE